MSALWQWLKKTPPHTKPLAWCHTTDAYGFRTILETGSLSPQLCSVFKEDLIYFFYGRPAYRLNNDAGAVQSAKAPVVIMLDPDITRRGRRLYPFDTGAFEAKRYAKWMHEKMKLTDFQLKCEPDAPKRYVSAFFGDNDNYLLQRSRARRKSADPLAFEVETIQTMLADTDVSQSDGRRIAMELQVPTTIPLDATAVLAIILPEDQLSSPIVKQFLRGTGKGIETVGYRRGELQLSLAYQVALEDHATALNKQWGYL